MMTEQYVGRVLDRRYQILEFIASGGMAQVYRAVHVGTGRPLAVKILKPKARDNPDNIRRFQREARLTATLEHENIIDIIDVQTDEEVYLVMELLAGVDLRVYLRRAGRLSWAEVRAIMLQICDAMQFAHDRGVVHRDLKPANCFRVEPGGRIKVLDLGIARPIAPLLGDPSRITLTGIPTGTPAYMAPEHFCGRADVQTDIYSAGVLMFELLTGRRPFIGEDTELLRQIMNMPIPALASVADDLDCPPGAGAVIERALAKLPELRHASMRAFAGAITALNSEVATIVVQEEARPTVGAEPLSSAAASDDVTDPTTIALVRMAAPVEPADAPPDTPELTASPLREPLDPPPDTPEITAILVRESLDPPPVKTSPDTARCAATEAPQRQVVARTTSTDRRWLGGFAVAICLAAAGLVQLWRAREPSEPEIPTRPTAAVAAGFPDPVDPPLVVLNASTPLQDAPSDGATQFAAGKPANDVNVRTLRSDTISSPPAAAPRDADPNVPTSSPPAASPRDTAATRPAPPTAEDAARAAASARQKRQRAAERSVQGVLEREGVGALVSRVKVTVQWSAAGEVTEAIVHSLSGGAERTGVEGRLRELPAPPGAGPVRVDRTFELKLPG